MQNALNQPSGERDHAAIRDIIYRMARSIDRMDWSGIRALADPDTYFDYGIYKGDVEGLIAWMSERHKGVFRSSHLIGNIIIEFAGRAALCEAYVNANQRSLDPRDPEAQVDVLSSARYIDEFRLEGDRWRLKSRRVAIDNLLMLPAFEAPVGANDGKRDQTDILWSERKRLGIAEPARTST